MYNFKFLIEKEEFLETLTSFQVLFNSKKNLAKNLRPIDLKIQYYLNNLATCSFLFLSNTFLILRTKYNFSDEVGLKVILNGLSSKSIDKFLINTHKPSIEKLINDLKNHLKVKDTQISVILASIKFYYYLRTGTLNVPKNLKHLNLMISLMGGCYYKAVYLLFYREFSLYYSITSCGLDTRQKIIPRSVLKSLQLRNTFYLRSEFLIQFFDRVQHKKVKKLTQLSRIIHYNLQKDFIISCPDELTRSTEYCIFCATQLKIGMQALIKLISSVIHKKSLKFVLTDKRYLGISEDQNKFDLLIDLIHDLINSSLNYIHTTDYGTVEDKLHYILLGGLVTNRYYLFAHKLKDALKSPLFLRMSLAILEVDSDFYTKDPYQNLPDEVKNEYKKNFYSMQKFYKNRTSKTKKYHFKSKY